MEIMVTSPKRPTHDKPLGGTSSRVTKLITVRKFAQDLDKSLKVKK